MCGWTGVARPVITHLEPDHSPAILEDGKGVPEGWVVQVQTRAVSAVVVDPQAITQHPEVVPMHVEGVLLLSCPVGSHSSTTVIAACQSHHQGVKENAACVAIPGLTVSPLHAASLKTGS